MIRLEKLNDLFRPPRISRTRIALALLVALIADGLQIPSQAIPIVPEVIDVLAAVLTIWILGFHLLLLPTFVVELIPLVDMLPTWTACVGAVLFAVHPVQVETVAWASGMKDLLCGLFVVGAMVAYVRSVDGVADPVGRKKGQETASATPSTVAIGIGLMVLGMLSKPTAMVTPALVVMSSNVPSPRTRSSATCSCPAS